MHHLARLGWRDIVQIDKGALPNPGGSTGHASNFIFPVDHSREITDLTLDSMRQYKELGVFTESGGYEVARTVVDDNWTPFLGELEDAASDAKSVLQEWAQGRQLPLPSYVEIAREGPDHAPRFTSEVQVEGVEPERGEGTSKRQAEQAAAQAMLEREGVWGTSDDE